MSDRAASPKGMSDNIILPCISVILWFGKQPALTLVCCHVMSYLQSHCTYHTTTMTLPSNLACCIVSSTTEWSEGRGAPFPPGCPCPISTSILWSWHLAGVWPRKPKEVLCLGAAAALFFFLRNKDKENPPTLLTRPASDQDNQHVCLGNA